MSVSSLDGSEATHKAHRLKLKHRRFKKEHGKGKSGVDTGDGGNNIGTSCVHERS